MKPCVAGVGEAPLGVATDRLRITACSTILTEGRRPLWKWRVRCEGSAEIPSACCMSTSNVARQEPSHAGSKRSPRPVVVLSVMSRMPLPNLTVTAGCGATSLQAIRRRDAGADYAHAVRDERREFDVGREPWGVPMRNSGVSSAAEAIGSSGARSGSRTSHRGGAGGTRPAPPARTTRPPPESTKLEPFPTAPGDLLKAALELAR